MSPLKPAEDAITFDTTGVSIDGVVEFIQEKAKKISSDLMTAINILSR